VASLAIRRTHREGPARPGATGPHYVPGKNRERRNLYPVAGHVGARFTSPRAGLGSARACEPRPYIWDTGAERGADSVQKPDAHPDSY